jgi:hypothetical protein
MPTLLRLLVVRAIYTGPAGPPWLRDVLSINMGDIDLRAVMVVEVPLNRKLEKDFSHAVCRTLGDARRDWEGKTTGKDFWELAEEIVERRREQWLENVR